MNTDGTRIEAGEGGMGRRGGTTNRTNPTNEAMKVRGPLVARPPDPANRDHRLDRRSIVFAIREPTRR